MRRAPSQLHANLTAVLSAKGKLGSYLHLYLLLFLLVIFATTGFFSVPHQHTSDELAARHHAAAGNRASTGSLRGTATALHAVAAKAAAAQAQAAATAGTVVAAAGAGAGGSLAAADAPAACHTEPGAEYGGEDVITWGTDNLQDSAAACCASCQAAQSKGCNVWVWCGSPAGCEGGRGHRECWLKRQKDIKLHAIAGARGTNFTSGALFSDAERDAAVAAERARLAALRADANLPLVWLDVAVRGRPAGRIHFALFVKEAPRAAENFRQLCTGEAGVVPPGREGAGQRYSLKGRPFYRIIHQFIDQAGAEVESVFGGQFKDDAGGLALAHDRKGLLSMANTGPNTNTAHFSIMVAAAPHLNGHYTIFGEAVDGHDVIDAVNALSRGKPDNTATAADGAVISDCGQLRKGAHAPRLDQA